MRAGPADFPVVELETTIVSHGMPYPQDVGGQGTRHGGNAFLPSYIGDLTSGRSLTANIALVESNARLAADVSIALAKELEFRPYGILSVLLPPWRKRGCSRAFASRWAFQMFQHF